MPALVSQGAWTSQRRLRTNGPPGDSRAGAWVQHVPACLAQSVPTGGPGDAGTHLHEAGSVSRRQLLLAALTLPPAGSLLLVPRPALASVPELSAAGQWGLPFLPVTPEPIRFPRKALNLRFAVLLMRSSYDAANALDFTPMDKFEAAFWKLRQSEQEGYNLLYAPLKMRQGDLTDPLYFDFISFSQYSTISREMARPLSQFSEYVEVCPPGAGEDDPCEAGSQLVQRPERFADDTRLPDYFVTTAGDLIYSGLLNGFQGTQFGGPAPPSAGTSIQQLAAGVQQLLDAMLRAGYALGAAVTDVQPAASSGGGTFTVTVTGPCNLWAMGALKVRNAAVINAYDVMATSAWLARGGRRSSHELELTDAGLLERWTVV